MQIIKESEIASTKRPVPRGEFDAEEITVVVVAEPSMAEIMATVATSDRPTVRLRALTATGEEAA